MADGGYSDSDLEYADWHREAMPSVLEIIMMCNDLDIEKDDFRTVRIEDAWEYFNELKEMLAKKRAQEGKHPAD